MKTLAQSECAESRNNNGDRVRGVCLPLPSTKGRPQLCLTILGVYICRVPQPDKLQVWQPHFEALFYLLWNSPSKDPFSLLCFSTNEISIPIVKSVPTWVWDNSSSSQACVKEWIQLHSLPVVSSVPLQWSPKPKNKSAGIKYVAV